VCDRAGYGPSGIAAADWFAAQNTLDKCEDIAQAFGVTGAVLGSGALGCIEDTAIFRTTLALQTGLNGPLTCSSNPNCPANQLHGITNGAVWWCVLSRVAVGVCRHVCVGVVL
jgi:hypothetical protein